MATTITVHLTSDEFDDSYSTADLAKVIQRVGMEVQNGYDFGEINSPFRVTFAVNVGD